MKVPVRPANCPPLVAGRPGLSRRATPALFAALACACAHAGTSGRPPATTGGAPDSVSAASGASAAPSPAAPPGTQLFRNEVVGDSVALPAGAGFVTGNEANLLAQAPDTTSVRVFVERLAQAATPAACWARILSHLSTEPKHPQTVEELRAVASQGMDRGDRRVYLKPLPRGDTCLVLVAEGPKDSHVLAEAAPLALRTFTLSAPAGPFTAELDIQGGLELLEAKQFEPALHRFEAALQSDPHDLRAEFGAGLAAYFAGPTTAQAAIDHLTKVVESREDDQGESPATTLQPEQYRDALMYLGLAYAATKEFKHASNTLAELVDRFPDDAVGRYNFACVLALAGDSDEALDQLRDALQREPDLTDHARDDDDLRSLHPLPAWKTIVGESERSDAAKARPNQ